MSPRPALVFIVGLASGLLAGRAVLPKFSPASAPASFTVTGPTPAGATDADRSTSDLSSPRPRAVRASPGGPMAGGYHLWETLALRGAPSGNEAKWFKIPDMTGQEGYDAASPDAPLNSAFVQFFDLTPEERDRVQTLLQTTLRRQHEMDVARIERIESKFRLKDAIAIPAYPGESAALRQSFEGDLRAILGDSRNRVYRDWAANTFRGDFPGLAGVRREYHFIPPRKGDDPGVQIVTVKIAPGETWTGMHSTGYYQTPLEALERIRLPLGSYFPLPSSTTPPAPAATP